MRVKVRMSAASRLIGVRVRVMVSGAPSANTLDVTVKGKVKVGVRVMVRVGMRVRA